MRGSMSKRSVIWLLVLSLVFALAGCSSDAGQTAVPADPGEEPSGQTENGYDFPDIRFFDASLLDGSASTGEELFAGKDVTVINCWATWCPPCLEEMDELAAFAKTLPDNVQLITYCVDGTQHRDECARVLEEADFEGTTMISANGDFTTLIEQMQYVPTTLFVDSVGCQLCDSLIGSPTDLAAAYTECINAGLKSLGKGTL